MHLKHFVGVNPPGQIWTYDSQTGTGWSATPENTAVVGDFYTAQQADGSTDTRIESFLSKIESDAVHGYDQVLRGNIPTDPNIRAQLSMFLAMMHVRTTKARRMAGEIVGHMTQAMTFAHASHTPSFERTLKKLEAERGNPLSSEERDTLRKNLLDPSNFILQIPKELTLPALAAADELAKLIFAMNWSVAFAKHGYFISSDNPLVRSVDPKTHHPLMGDHGFRNKTALLTFPISPEVILMMSWQSDAPQTGVCNREIVQAINATTASHSDRFLFAHIDDKRIHRLAKAQRNNGPLIAVSGFGPENYAKIEVTRGRKK